MNTRLYPFCTIAAYTSDLVSVAGCLNLYVPTYYPFGAIKNQLASIIESENADDDEINSIIDELNELRDDLELPAYCSIQFHEGELMVLPNLEDAKESVSFHVSDGADIPAGFIGEALVINDHGNVTLYSCNGADPDNSEYCLTTEIWGLV